MGGVVPGYVTVAYLINRRTSLQALYFTSYQAPVITDGGWSKTSDALPVTLSLWDCFLDIAQIPGLDIQRFW